MKKITVFVFLLITYMNFAQETCGKEVIENFIQEKLGESRQKEVQNQKRYEKAVGKLAVLNKWDKKAELAYLSKVLTSESYQQSTKVKYTIISEVMDLLSTVDAKASSGNCKILTSLQDMLQKVIQKNNEEWNKLIDEVNSDYEKVAATKGTSPESSEREEIEEVTPNPLRPVAFIGTWLDTEKEENFVFAPDGTVFNQKSGTDNLYNMRYWYSKEGKICFTSSDETEGGICVPYLLDNDTLSMTIFGDEMKYQRK
ncbi:hypothetical protein ABW636_17040 [Aquimarina sp. 2201CG1-2-11]|uniref:hypothetical protein n=1 Tax=Aquimarina discodermiae TaxID=3231043 RepID=UPI00346238CA